MYELPKLKYSLNDLQPFMSEEQLKIHYEKHHLGYVNGSNDITTKLSDARKNNIDLDMKSMLKSLSFNLGGHILHSLFWNNLKPNKTNATLIPIGDLSNAINSNFGSFERFKKEFSATALSIEGSGWVGLAFDDMSKKLMLVQIEKHNTNLYPTLNLLLVLDMWEHAFYIDHKNLKAKYVENFWSIVDWDEVNNRFMLCLK